MTRSPTRGRDTQRGPSPSGSPGAGVRMSPDSQHGPTKTTSAGSRPVTSTSTGCWAPYIAARVTSVLPGVHYVDACRQHHTRLRHEVRPGLDLEMEGPALALAKAFELAGYVVG